MKDAFGGAFILRIMIAFFIVFICFMTFAVSFTRVFRVKTGVISILEKYYTDNAEEKIENYLDTINYSSDYATDDKIEKNCSEQVNHGSFEGSSFKALNGNIMGVCIVPYGTEDAYFYKVTAYIVLDFPLFHFGGVIPVSGETKTFNKILE